MFPEATFYFLRPMFMADGSGELCLGDSLRWDEKEDREYAIFLARLYGWYFRRREQCRQAARIAAACALEVATTWIRRASRNADRRDMPMPTAVFESDTDRLKKAAAEFQATLSELERHVAIDPILCFELPQSPGKLWFEAHWYLGCDDRLYVHY